MAFTITSNRNSEFALNRSDTADNPLTIAAGVTVSASGSYAIYTSYYQSWNITNLGTLLGKYGVLLNDADTSPGSVLTNSGTAALISGTDIGVEVFGSFATVTNQGTIIGGSERRGGPRRRQRLGDEQRRRRAHPGRQGRRLRQRHPQRDGCGHQFRHHQRHLRRWRVPHRRRLGNQQHDQRAHRGRHQRRRRRRHQHGHCHQLRHHQRGRGRRRFPRRRRQGDEQRNRRGHLRWR